MGKKCIVIGVLLIFSLLSVSGCHWAGRQTGKAVKKTEKTIKKIQNAPKKFERGYKEGRN